LKGERNKGVFSGDYPFSIYRAKINTKHQTTTILSQDK